MRKTNHLIIAAALILTAASSFAATLADPVAALKADMPKPVEELIDRIVDCNHWAGEEPYDQHRKKEIDEAIKSLRCQRLDQDARQIAKRFSSDPRVQKRIDSAKEIVL